MSFLRKYDDGLVNDDYLLKLYGSDGCEEVLSELTFLRDSFKSRMEQYLKIQIQVRGYTVIENTYLGFDTEYTLKDQKRFLNELVSVQSAVQRRFILKMPLYKPYDISYVNPLSSVVSDVFSNKVGSDSSYKYMFSGCGNEGVFDIEGMLKDESRVNVNEILLINDCIKPVILLIRDLLFKDTFELNSLIIDELKKVSSFSYFEDVQRDQIVFLLPLTGVESKIVFPVGDGFSFLDLLEMSKDVCGLIDCERSSTQVSTYFNEFRGGSLSLSGGGGEESFVKSMPSYFLLLVSLFTNLGLINCDKIFEFYNIKKLKPRARLNIFFNINNSITKTKISLTIVKNVFVVGHYNAADLSMFSDFNELKKKLSVVNKSFVSLGKPLRINEYFVYFRDTMLLSPGGGSKLKDLGNLYSSEGFEKVDISNKDISNMRDFLKREPEKFKNYAIQDAVITLKHATAMEEFNMKVNQIGVPLTLSSIGRKYVLMEWGNIFRKHLPYQVSGEYLMGNADEIQTPKGLFASRNIGTHMSYFIANYKGGRNESFMYGVDEKTH